MTSKVTGGPEVIAVLRKLPPVLQKRALDNALRSGARLIRDAAKERVPVDSGDLRDSITVAKPRGSTTGDGHIAVGFKKGPSRRAHLVEYGTSKMAAQPFMRPALAATGRAAIRRIGERLGAAVAAQAKRLAGPLTRKQRARIFK